MMKKSVAKLGLYVVIILFFVLGALIANNLLERENIIDRISQWPDLKVQTLEGESVSTSRLPDERPILLTYFNTECIFCQHKFEAILIDGNLQEEALLLFVSDEDPEIVERFRNETGLGRDARLIFLYDHELQIKDFYRIRSVPVSYLYSTGGKIIQYYRGQVGIERIREELAVNQ